jgi:hypothetical protein
LDRAFFNKINADKLVKQAKLGKKLTWEQYIRELFGFGTKHITSFIKERMPKETFTIKELINKMGDAKKYTDGSLQRILLSLFTCQGIIKKVMQTTKDKKDNLKFRIVYSLNDPPVPCKYLVLDKCSLIWRTARTTKFFTNKEEEKEDDNRNTG